MEEEEIIAKIKKHPEYFGLIYDEHYNTIFNYCYKRTGDFDLAKDICSETFLKAYLNISRFKWKGVSVMHWLYRIATNEINLHYRNKKYRPKLLCETGIIGDLREKQLSSAFQDEKTEAEEEIRRYKQFLEVREKLKKLPLKYQEVISLKYFEKQKIREIGIILNKPEGTIKSLLSRGINLLKQQF